MTTPEDHRRQTELVLGALDEPEDTLRAYAASLLGLVPGETVLDVGSGPGSSVDAMHDIGAHVVCLDVSADMLNAIDRAVVRVQGLGEALPIRTEAVDAVLCVGVVHSVDPDDLQTFLGELLRVVKRGGRVVLVNKGLAPWKWATRWYDVMRRLMGDVACDWPPLSLLPAEARDVSVRWFAGGAFYALVYQR